jgi:Rne/Rng family ribonuclease
MSRDLIVSVSPGEVRAGLFFDGRATDLRVERDTRESLVGAIFLGRIARVLPALPGCFVELGLARPAFLPGRRTIAEGEAVLVQIVKDAHADKAPEVSTAFELTADHIVWTPHRPGVAASRQLAPEAKVKLAALLEPMVREGEGVLLRSHAIAASPRQLAAEIEGLRKRYAALRRAARAAEPPARLDEAGEPLDRVISALGASSDRILVDDRASVAAIHRAVSMRAELVLPTSEAMASLDEALEAALDPVVALPDGAHLTIEAATAFIAVDVDLGAAAGQRGTAEDEIRRVNLAAAEALVNEARLRNLGGAIVVDFVSMANKRHRQDVEAVLAAGFAADPVGVELHGWTRLGHYELTRRRVLPPLADIMLERSGPRRQRSAVTVGLALLRAAVREKFSPRGLSARLHPSVVAALRGPLARHFLGACDRMGQDLVLVEDPACDAETFDLSNGRD